MTSFPQTLNSSRCPVGTGTAVHPSARLTSFAWTIQFSLFLMAVTCTILPHIMGNSDESLMVRQIAYTTYVLPMFLVGFCCSWRVSSEVTFYLGCAALVSSAAIGAVLTTPSGRPFYYFGPVGFLIGVYVFTHVIPHVLRGSAESIVLATMVIVTATVCISYHFRVGVSIEQNNTVAVYSGLTTLLLVIRALRRGTSLTTRFLCWVGATALLLILAASFGRTSMIAFAGSGFVLVWLGSGVRGRVALFVALLFVIFSLTGTEFGSSLIRTFLSKGLDWHMEQETLQTLSSRTDIWMAGLSSGGWTWLGYGPEWIIQLTGHGPHSSYFDVYFAHGVFALFFWLIMCAISLRVAVMTTRLHAGRGSYPLAPAMVLYFLTISISESFFGLLISGCGILFYMGTGMCFLELRRAREIYRPLVSGGHGPRAAAGWLRQQDGDSQCQ